LTLLGDTGGDLRQGPTRGFLPGVQERHAGRAHAGRPSRRVRREGFIFGRFKGTHQGDLVSPQWTIAASGNALDLPYADYFRVEADESVEPEVVWDSMTMLAQLGAAPPQ
jgi:hypothetical protein